jgi:gluconolactonase
VFATCDAGSFDGLRLDETGRLWAAAHDGLHCFDPDGTLLGKLHIPEIVANFTFGGVRRNHLFICASSSVYTLRVNFNGGVYPC